MPRTIDEIAASADKLAARFENYDPPDGAGRDAAPLRELRKASETYALAHRALIDAVSVARAAGHSWTSIGAMVGTSGEAARQRYGLGAAPARKTPSKSRKRTSA
jgi:hypothetical protein